uniref:Uncharacterized protein n=1 Tax=Wuchereria bancrofti TaxID=6293 RepID=A0AAF5PWG2_WUCBA
MRHNVFIRTRPQKHKVMIDAVDSLFISCVLRLANHSEARADMSLGTDDTLPVFNTYLLMQK